MTRQLTEECPKLAKPLPDEAVETLLGGWYGEFVKGLGEEELFEVILAANELNIEALLEITAAAVSRMIKDMKVQEVRQFFSIENDFTPEEEKRIEEENEFAAKSF